MSTHAGKQENKDNSVHNNHTQKQANTQPTAQLVAQRLELQDTDHAEHTESTVQAISDNRPLAKQIAQLHAIPDNRPLAKQIAQLHAMPDNRPLTKQIAQLHAMPDNRPLTKQIAQLHAMPDNRPLTKQIAQLQAMADNHNSVQKKSSPEQTSGGNSTGLPDGLKSGIENLSGYAMDDVKVHRNSDKPAQLQAHAYAQGTDIHLGPGQEKHLPHEAWHVAQQKQGRVQATVQKKGGVNINDDAGLEREADIMGAKALTASSPKGGVMQQKTVNGVLQKKDDRDEKVLSDLKGRAKGEERDYNYGSLSAKSKAAEYADAYFEHATGEVNFAQNLIQDINDNAAIVYDQIRDGQISAVEGIQKSMNDQHEREQMIKTCLLSFASIIAAWAPMAAASVASAEASIMTNLQAQVGKGLKVSSIKIPAYAQKIKSFGESTLVSPWLTTVKTVNDLIKTKPTSAKDSIKVNVNDMKLKTVYAVNALVLEMGMMLKNDPSQKLSPDLIAGLKTSLQTEVMKTIFPEYSGSVATESFNQVFGLAKTSMLKNIILNSGEISKSRITESWDSIEGNKNKEGKSIVGHALNAMGGESEFIKSLDNPNEFAFASLKSSLGHMGLSINTEGDADLMNKAAKTDYLNKNRGFKINIDDSSIFKNFLNDKQIVTNNLYVATNGPIKDMKEQHPGESGGLLGAGSYTGYEFSYENVNAKDMEVWVHPSQYISMMNGQVKDIKSFTLKFNTSGNATVYQYKVTSSSGYGGRRGRNKYGEQAVNGMNDIKVNF